MNIRVVLKTTLLLFACIAFTANAMFLKSDSLPQLQEWWRAPYVEQEGYLGEGLTFLPNFYNGKNAIALRTSRGVHTWLNQFPGDTQNVFTLESRLYQMQ